MRKDSTLTAADLDNIVTENFAPDIQEACTRNRGQS